MKPPTVDIEQLVMDEMLAKLVQFQDDRMMEDLVNETDDIKEFILEATNE